MKQLTKSLFRVFPKKQLFRFGTPKQHVIAQRNLLFTPRAYFCDKLTPGNIPKQNLQVVHLEAVVGDQVVDSYKTKGSISILDHIKGTKQSESGELYALMFRCGQCNTRAIRSFTKNAYHKGVVLVRCQGCQNIHLVADNLGWFEDNPSNIENLSDEKVQKVHDPVAIVSFLKAAFGEKQKEKGDNEGEDKK